MASWYYADGDTRHGPVEATEVERLISAGQLGANSLVWRPGLDEWEAASSHFPAAGGAGTPTPLSSAPPSVPSSGNPETSSQIGGDGLYVGAPSRGFGEAITVCFSKFATFSGRASRSEYWFFTLFNVLVSFVTGVVDALLFPTLIEASPVSSIYSLVVLLPTLAVSWRRLHDTDRSGWWIGGFYLALLLFGVIGFAAMVSTGGDPSGASVALLVVGGLAALGYTIAILVFFCQKGTLGPNRFG